VTALLDGFVTHGDIAAFASDRINLKQDDVAEARLQVGRLRERVGAYIAEHPGYDLVKTLHSGSVAKGTALKNLNDMDVAVYVRRGKVPEEEGALLVWMSERVREAYKNVLKPEQITPGDHCVAVNFRGSGLNVDVVPVLCEDDPDDRGYLIPKSTGNRVLTSIPLHLKFIRARKVAHKTHYRQMVRIVKWWARTQKADRDGFRFKSFLTELLLAKLMDDGFKADDYAQALFEFFSYIVKTRLSERIVFDDYYPKSKAIDDGSPIRIIDPVNPDNNVASRYTAADLDIVIEAAADAQDAIAMARRATTKGDAVDEWQMILGTAFKGA